MSQIKTEVFASIILVMLLPGMTTLAQTGAFENDLRQSPVSYHMSFDNRDFFEEDFIERSGKKTLEERKIDFPEGKFGRGIRMSFVPAPPDASNMTGIDLDLVTAVIFNTRPGNTMGYNEPFIWGSGRINPRLGAVAFWAKGELPFAGPLFEQTSISFGRTERDLLGVLVNENNKLSAYVRDASYVRHELDSDIVWDGSIWNHIVMNWDWINGMELWLNGEKIASSWGTDGWFETAPPGLFHLPAPGIAYDELYLMDRPLSESEIEALMSSNNPPEEESPIFDRKEYNSKRVAEYSGADASENLPVASPDKALSFSEVLPLKAADGHIPGMWIIDGRNEVAWPHPYAMFTIIPGDGDFHAEKVDIETPPESVVNYVALTGNLTNVKVQASSQDMEDPEDLFHVPSDGFFYGSTITAIKGGTFRIPFTEKFGTPPGFSGDVNLPLSGEKRVQDIGLYYVSENPSKEYTSQVEKLTLSISEPDLDERTQFAMHAVTSRDERKIALASTGTPKGGSKKVDIGAFSRLNILSKPYKDEEGISAVTLSLPIKTLNSEETLFVRVRDPAIPSRLWNQFALRLQGFDKGFEKLSLTIDFHDIVLTGGDRLWIDLGTVGKTEIKIGDKKNPAEISIRSIESYRAIDAYAEKEMISAEAQYSKQYEFMPWQFTGREISIEEPFSYGGPFDMLMPALAVNRVKPDHFVANYLIKVSGPDYNDGKLIEPEKAELITLPNPLEAPEWALYMRDYNKKREAMIDWWSQRQNPDGQIGGGWNDDTLFLRGMVDLALSGNEQARAIIDSVYAGFEVTNLYREGYCNIYPIDRMHAGDFISERYTTVLMNLGQAYATERSMESAWRLGKPEQTPGYYAEAFKSAVNVLQWYWGKDVPENPYVSKPLAELAKEFRLYTSVFDEYNFYRMTASNVMHDDFSPFGSTNLYSYILGGPDPGAGVDAHIRHAVTWPSGGGAEIPRIVMYADDESLDAVVYSFDGKMRNLKMRLARINDGRYRIGLYTDPDGTGDAGTAVWTTEKDLSRFDVVNLPIPSKTSLVIKVEQIESYDSPGELPDLAIDPWDAVFQDGKIIVTIHNIGNKEAESIKVSLLDGEQTLQEKMISHLDAPTDFVAKRSQVTFEDVSFSRNLKIVIDSENDVREILEENNNAAVGKPGNQDMAKTVAKDSPSE